MCLLCLFNFNIFVEFFFVVICKKKCVGFIYCWFGIVVEVVQFVMEQLLMDLLNGVYFQVEEVCFDQNGICLFYESEVFLLFCCFKFVLVVVEVDVDVV